MPYHYFCYGLLSSALKWSEDLATHEHLLHALWLGHVYLDRGPHVSSLYVMFIQQALVSKHGMFDVLLS